MWHCPNCGEQIDDVFDARWKCGTAQDGTLPADFQVEPGDAETPDARAEPDPPDEIAANDPKNERIVELCSAANAAEAYAIRALLEGAGIRSRVVGESLGNAAGWLPLGETIAPRVWVREEDAARAREIVDEQINQPCEESSSPADRDEPAALDASSEEGGVPGVAVVRFRWLGRGLLIVGLACLLLGTALAWNDWILMRTYAGTAEGVAVGYEPHYSIDSNTPSEIPIPRVTSTISYWYEVQYAFVVNGKIYYSVDPHCQRFFRRIPTHYDPHDPASNIRGSLTSPWSVLAFTVGIGGSLSLVGYYLARTGRQRSSG